MPPPSSTTSLLSTKLSLPTVLCAFPCNSALCPVFWSGLLKSCNFRIATGVLRQSPDANCKTAADCKCKFLIGKLLSYYPPRGSRICRIPKTADLDELAWRQPTLYQDHQDGRQFWRDRRGGRSRNRRPYDRSAGGLQEEAYRHDSTRRAGLPQRWGIHDSMKCEANTSGKVQYDQSSRFGGSSGKKVSGFLLASFPGPSFPFFPLKKGN